MHYMLSNKQANWYVNYYSWDAGIKDGKEFENCLRVQSQSEIIIQLGSNKLGLWIPMCVFTFKNPRWCW